MRCVLGGVFESDEFAPNIPQLGRKTKGPRFNRFHKESDDLTPDPSKQGAAGLGEKNITGRNQQYDGYLQDWDRPRNTQAEKVGNRLSRGDIIKGRNPNY